MLRLVRIAALYCQAYWRFPCVWIAFGREPLQTQKTVVVSRCDPAKGQMADRQLSPQWRIVYVAVILSSVPRSHSQRSPAEGMRTGSFHSAPWENAGCNVDEAAH